MNHSQRLGCLPKFFPENFLSPGFTYDRNSVGMKYIFQCNKKIFFLVQSILRSQQLNDGFELIL